MIAGRKMLTAYLLMLFMAGALIAQADIFTEYLPDIHGYLGVNFEDFQEEKATFNLWEAEILFKGTLTEDLSAMIEIMKEEDGIEFCWMYIEWKLADFISARLGRFYMPFGFERQVWFPNIRKTISHSYLAEEITYCEWDETGLMISGQVPISTVNLKYDACIVNGPMGLTEDDLQVTDNNDNKTAGARIGFLPVEQLELGGSYATGKYDDAEELSFNLMGGYAKLMYKGLDIQGEYALRKADEWEAGEIEEEETTGYYVQAAYTVFQGKKWLNYVEPFVRYDMYDEEDEGLRRITAGINVSPHPHFVMKLEYQNIEEKEDPQIDNDGIVFQGAIAF